MEIVIKVVNDYNEYVKVADLAEKIWTEHFTPIIGLEQVVYMLEKFQKADVMYGQCLNDGYQYYQAFCDGKQAGYCGIKKVDEKSIFLSKLYVDKDYRGFGIAKRMISHFIEEHKNNHIERIFLTVNKSNMESIAAYKKMGFDIVEEIMTDIGNGFFMDDYKMQLIL